MSSRDAGEATLGGAAGPTRGLLRRGAKEADAAAELTARALVECAIGEIVEIGETVAPVASTLEVLFPSVIGPSYQEPEEAPPAPVSKPLDEWLSVSPSLKSQRTRP